MRTIMTVLLTMALTYWISRPELKPLEIYTCDDIIYLNKVGKHWAISFESREDIYLVHSYYEGLDRIQKLSAE